jgi:hypothetical protein
MDFRLPISGSWTLDGLILAVICTFLLITLCCCICFWIRARKQKRGSGAGADLESGSGKPEESQPLISDATRRHDETDSEEKESKPVPVTVTVAKAPKPIALGELPIARVTLPYLNPAGKNLSSIRDQLEADLEEMFGPVERTDEETVEEEGEDEGKVIEAESNWIFEIRMEDNEGNRKELLGLANWLRDAAELDKLDVQLASGEVVRLTEEA